MSKTNDLYGKKLLIMGGNPETIPLIELANDMGIYTIVTDDNPKAPGKKHAKKSYDINGLDVDGIVDMAKKEAVDGVLVGVADILIGAYQKVCDRLELPCYASEQSVDVLTQKDHFKRTCESYGISGIPEYQLTVDMKREDLDRIEYPVLVKPVDNGGGVGMTICWNEEELKYGVKKALDNSRGKRFIVERYMTCDDMFVYYTFKDGEYELSAIADRFTSKEQGELSPVCLGAAYPSKYRDLYFETMHDNACRMFKDIGIKNGILLMQGFVENGRIHVYDPGFRFQGEAPHLLINSINGFDQRIMMIRYALTGDMGEINLSDVNDSNFGGKAAGSLWILLKKGKIAEIIGMERLNEDTAIVHIVQRLYEGDEVTESMVGNEKQVLARIYIVCDDRQSYKNKIREIESYFDVKDKEGNSLLIKQLDADDLWA